MRRSPRLHHFDYSSAGAYFVTINVNDRGTRFGDLNTSTGTVTLNDAGEMIDRWWTKLPDKFSIIELDAHVVMPDHLHGIVVLNCAAMDPDLSRTSLSHAVHWFKTMTTAEYFRGVRANLWPPVRRRLWQRSFYDRVIRNECELLEIRKYIESNPGALYERFGGRTRGSAPTPPK
jgi:putative transposase